MKLILDVSKFKLPPDFLKSYEQELTQALNQEMQKVRARIIASNTAGQQAEGGGLKPYSSSYKAAIDSGRVAGKAPGNHTPNLTATGTLHRSMKIEPGDQPTEVRMFFEGTHPPARKVKNPGNRVKQVNKRRAARGEAAVVPHKHVPSAEQKAVRSARAKASRVQAKFNAAFGRGSRLTTASDRRGSGLGGGDTQNAVIAQAQYDMGRTGWFTFSKADLERIQKRVADLVAKLLAKSIGGK